MNKVILIVEDDTILQKNLADFFSDEGFTVLQAGNGAAGLSIAVEQKPDIILLDIVMPIMDGLTMLKKLREEHPDFHAPVILLTVLEADDKIMNAVVKNEPSYYLVKKEWTLHDVLEKVQSTLGAV